MRLREWIPSTFHFQSFPPQVICFHFNMDFLSYTFLSVILAMALRNDNLSLKYIQADLKEFILTILLFL